MSRKHRSSTSKRRQKNLVNLVAPTRSSNRKKLSDLASSWLLALLIMGAVWSGWLGLILHDLAPEALRTGNRIPIGTWGWKGDVVIGSVVVMGLAALTSVALFKRCRDLLIDRHLK